MKTTLFAVTALVLVAVIGCGTGLPASPIALPAATQISSVEVEPTLVSTDTITPINKNGFAIYLLANNAPPEQLAILSHLELENEPVLTIDDIVSYAQATHEIELTAAGYERIHRFHVPTSGVSFAVCVNGEPIFSGAFWTLVSSQSFDGVVILVDPIDAAKELPVIQIQLGYPGPDFFHGDDPRSDPRILEALEQAGKLR